MSPQAVGLVVALLIGHFLGDFTPLATARIQQAKAEGGPQRYIAAHAAVHALLTGVAVLAIARPTPGVLVLAVGIQFATHWVLDGFRARMGASMPALGDPSANAFWTALGIDQLAHGLVLLGIAALVL